MKKAFAISIIFNVLFVLFGGYVIHKRGGIDYLKSRFNLHPEKVNQTDTANQLRHGVSYKTQKSIFEIMPNDTNEIIFLGNSITDYCEWHELFGNPNIKNRGIGRDVIHGVIARLDEIVESNPKKIFIMIGINDLGRKRTTEQILTDYDRLLSFIKQKSPETEIFIQSILPTDNAENQKIDDIIAINDGLKKLAETHHLTYVNLFDLFKTKENTLDTIYTYDGLHINGKGYLIWKQAIENYVNN
ncbi:MAG: GDSL-type esterase/lipase family protein [Bacteroidota bacterium]|nr:GDSL-type esterase/lipase family protein [Bacteroidota bacterium]